MVEDPLERANLKARLPEVYRRLTAAFRAWDAKMLPLDPKAGTWGFSGEDAADHFGITSTRTVPQRR